ncbi:hypothetical protein AMTRI_Chr06g192830 [Amborella trichopoda]|uniref:DEUBAD domain-containing protein n=1 Tax=Amborella trichopoda TaxID=13333 RepID=W1PDQ7_AMBTC|nr:uncharacterized protein LOC18434279 [Amborella trichopoda]ERN06093.1 hypothetical protein AMTR_s00016p00019360 [Amborella trichopoda]|eukprot:XP_020523026.1 uncharacterized protein LOC18434279 [Amborella trichopoda]
MAAGQQKRRLNGASVLHCNILEQHKEKKRKTMELSQGILRMRPHISLGWDKAQNKVIAKREQVGIAMRDLLPYVDPVPQSCKVVADVLSVPEEIYDLDNIVEILSYEVWQSCLTETERKFLSEFLPSHTEVDSVVQALLTGENFHFGNPLQTWGPSLCSGGNHPDAVHNREMIFKANKKAYYSELQTHQNNLLEILTRWKEKWLSCEDSETDIIQKIQRYSHVHEENKTLDDLPLAESCSSIGDEDVHTGEGNIMAEKCDISKKRKGLIEYRSGSSLAASARTELVNNLMKGRKQPKHLRSGNPASYISYFKVTQKQHQLVKSLIRSAQGIKLNSLNRVLGSVKNLDIQPLKALEEEEKKKFDEIWMKITERELPAAIADRRDRMAQGQQWRESIGEEIPVKRKTIIDKDQDKDSPKYSFQDNDPVEGKETRTVSCPIEVDDHEDNSVALCLPPQTLEHGPSLNSHHETILNTEDAEDPMKRAPSSPALTQLSTNCNENMVNRDVNIPLANGSWHEVTEYKPNFHSRSEFPVLHPNRTDPEILTTFEPCPYPSPERSEGFARASSLSLGPPFFKDQHRSQAQNESILPFLKDPHVPQLLDLQNQTYAQRQEFLPLEYRQRAPHVLLPNGEMLVQEDFPSLEYRQGSLFMLPQWNNSLHSRSTFERPDQFMRGNNEEMTERCGEGLQYVYGEHHIGYTHQTGGRGHRANGMTWGPLGSCAGPEVSHQNSGLPDLIRKSFF